MGFKLIVAGGRDFDDYLVLSEVLIDLVNGEYSDKRVSIVSGMARGADLLGHQFAKQHNVVCYEFPADWDTYGKSAGFIPNKQMGNFSDALLAFWRGSKGTQHMINYMRALNKPVHIVGY